MYNAIEPSVNTLCSNSQRFPFNEIRDPRFPMMNRSQLATLHVIEDYCRLRDGCCWARNQALAVRLGKSMETVSRHISKLVALGLIRCQFIGGDRRLFAIPVTCLCGDADVQNTYKRQGDDVALPIKKNLESPIYKNEQASSPAPVGAVVGVVVQANASLPERTDPCKVGKTSAVVDGAMAGHEIAAAPPSAGENVMPPLPRHTPPQERTPQSIRTQPLTAQTPPERANGGERIQTASEPNVEALAARLQAAGLSDAAACRRHAENNPALVRAWLAALPDNLKNTGGFLRSRLDAGVMPPDTSTRSYEPRTERKLFARRDDGPFAGCDRLERLRDITSIRLRAIAMARAAIKQGYVGG